MLLYSYCMYVVVYCMLLYACCSILYVVCIVVCCLYLYCILYILWHGTTASPNAGVKTYKSNCVIKSNQINIATINEHVHNILITLTTTRKCANRRHYYRASRSGSCASIAFSFT